MAASSWQMYDAFLELVADGTIDLDTHTFKCALWTSTNPPLQTDTSYTTENGVGGQLANGSGYTTGGATLGSVTWNRSANTVTFDCANPTWTASGGSLVFRYAVIYCDSDANKTLVCASLLDTTPGDITITDTNSIELQIDAAGVFVFTHSDWTI